jgi:NAD(P)H-flavin reductase
LVDELRGLCERHAHVTYNPTLSREDAASEAGVHLGRAHDVALSSLNKLSGWKVFLCGHPDMVNDAKMRAFLAGVSLSDIHADPFVFSTTPVAETGQNS